jgi:hypothetical protein
MMVEQFKIENETEAVEYLQDLLKRPEYRSMEEVHIRATEHIPDMHIRRFFIQRAEELLKLPNAS